MYVNDTLNRVALLFGSFASHSVLPGLVAGICIGIGFPMPFLWPLSIVGIAVLLYAVFMVQRTSQAFFVGYQSGMIVTLCVFVHFLFGIFPFDWFGIESIFLQYTLIIASWFFIALVFGLCTAVCVASIHVLASRTWFDLLLVPSIWVTFEWFSSAVFYLVMYGAGSFPGPHFTLHWIGYLLVEDPSLLQLSSIGGVYLLSFTLVFLGTLVYRLAVTDTHRIYYSALVALVIVFWVVGHILIPQGSETADTNPSLHVGVISRYLEPRDVQNESFRTARFDELFSLVAPLRGIDVLIFPENATFVRELRKYSEKIELLKMIGNNGTGPLVIDSEDFMDENGIHAAVHFYRDETTTFGSKQFLQPFGEYIPSAYLFLIRMLKGTDFAQSLSANRNYVPGSDIPIRLYKNVVLAVRFCNEVMSTELYRQQTYDGAEVLINISSLSWFHGSSGVFNQMQRIAKVRAVENRRWYLQSGNMASAFILDPYGRIIAQSGWHTPEVLTATIPEQNKLSLYTRTGQLIVAIFFLVIVGRLVWLVAVRE